MALIPILGYEKGVNIKRGSRATNQSTLGKTNSKYILSVPQMLFHFRCIDTKCRSRCESVPGGRESNERKREV